MSPDVFVFLDALPRTSTDKVDYQGLDAARARPARRRSTVSMATCSALQSTRRARRRSPAEAVGDVPSGRRVDVRPATRIILAQLAVLIAGRRPAFSSRTRRSSG